MTPRPPCCAMAMAISDSVTVSIAALSSGTLSLMFLREARADVDLRGQHGRVARDEQDVVEGERGPQTGARVTCCMASIWSSASAVAHASSALRLRGTS